MKIVINTTSRGFSLSKEAYAYLHKKWDAMGLEFYDDRTNPKLIKCVEKLGDRANGEYSKLKIIEIPDNIDWEISKYYGIECVEEKHRIWK